MTSCSVTAMEHFLFPGNIDFAANDQVALSCFIHEGLMCLFIVYETMFTIGESRANSHANDTEHQAQQVAANFRWGRFSTEPPQERERRIEIQHQQRRRRRQQETAEQKSRENIVKHSEGNARQQETEEQRNRRLVLPLFSLLSVLLITIGQIYIDFYKS